MNRLIFFALLSFSYIAYGQDLIVTVTHDSIKCKIVEVSRDEIKFRFGTNTNLIPIKRSEVASYQYNYMLSTGDANSGKTTSQKERKEKTATGNSPFYVAIAAGASTFGSYSIGELEKGTPFLFGVDAAYFFKPSLAAGIRVSAAKCNADLTAGGGTLLYNYDDLLIFAGPALFGRWGSDKFAVTAGVGAGMLNWNVKNLTVSGTREASYPDESAIGVGACISAGINYMITNNFGIALNLQSTIGKMSDSDGVSQT